MPSDSAGVQIVAGIFISYRRDDSAAHADRLYERLMQRYGDARVFMDIGTIEPGADFVEAIQAAAGSATVVLVLIGRTWRTSVDGTGQRRLENPPRLRAPRDRDGADVRSSGHPDAG